MGLERTCRIPVAYLADRAAWVFDIIKYYAPREGTPERALEVLLASKPQWARLGRKAWAYDMFVDLLGITISPTPQELRDLDVIDSYVRLRSRVLSGLPGVRTPKQEGRFIRFFTGTPKPGQDMIGGVGVTLTRSTSRQIHPAFGGATAQETLRPFGIPQVSYTQTGQDDPSLLPALNARANSGSYQNAMELSSGGLDYGAFSLFGDSDFCAVRSKIENRLNTIEAMNRYPWPGPAADFRRLWITDVSNTEPVLQFLNSPTVFSPEKARTVITISLISNYERIAAKIQAESEEEAERKKRQMTVMKIALAVWAAPFALAAAPLMAAAVKSVMVGINFSQQRQAGKSLVDAAKEFQASDAAFANELDRVGRELEAGAPPEHVDAYTLFVEGKEVGSADTVEEITKLAASVVKPGDRYEIFLDGQSLGYKIMGARQPIPVPEESREDVASKPPEVVQAAVKKAERGKFPWEILLAVPVGYGIVKGIS